MYTVSKNLCWPTLTAMIRLKNCLLQKNGRSALGWGKLLLTLSSRARLAPGTQRSAEANYFWLSVPRISQGLGKLAKVTRRSYQSFVIVRYYEGTTFFFPHVHIIRFNLFVCIDLLYLVFQIITYVFTKKKEKKFSRETACSEFLGARLSALGARVNCFLDHSS